MRRSRTRPSGTWTRTLGDGGIALLVTGNYPRPGKPEESVRGGYRLLVTPTGPIEVSYDYGPINATGEILEAGFALALPAAQSEFRRLGHGPYAGYSDKDRHSEYGLFHLNRDDVCGQVPRQMVQRSIRGKASFRFRLFIRAH